MTGRKRQILVDCDGSLLEVVVHSADISDQDGGKLVVEQAARRTQRCEQGTRYGGRSRGKLSQLELVWVDGSYAGKQGGSKLVEWCKRTYGLTLQVVKRSDDVKGFQVLPRRWVVERTFGWLGRYRRLSRDYEYLLLSSEVIIYAAMVRTMLRRLTDYHSY